jgi:hypothetical protein
MTAQTIPLSSIELEGAIEALSRAGQMFRLTRFEKGTYLGLLISADVAAAGLVLALLCWFAFHDLIISGLLLLVVVVTTAVGVILLALNIPLFRKVFRERKSLKERGLTALSQSLWKESRRGRWIRWLREATLIVLSVIIGVIVVLAVVAGLVREPSMLQRQEVVVTIIYWALAAALMASAQYLRVQAQRIELASNADALRKSLQSLRSHSHGGTVSVPTEFLVRTAKIESAEIMAQRRDAVLQSDAFRPNAYAVTFHRDAAEQKAALSLADRLELEDLVAQLSTGGAKLGSSSDASDGETRRTTTQSKRLAVAYCVDHAARSICINEIRLEGQAHA